MAHTCIIRLLSKPESSNQDSNRFSDVLVQHNEADKVPNKSMDKALSRVLFSPREHGDSPQEMAKSYRKYYNSS